MKRHHQNRPVNAISFDLEHWYTATLIRDEVSDPEDRIRESVGIVLDLLAEYDVEATFFVVGEVARDYPELVRTVADAGHDVASHGHTHRPLFELDRESFREELRRSEAAIENAIGARPDGFRAPNFSITPETDWALAELHERGYRYDSSLFPVRTPMYGVSGTPTQPYSVDLNTPFTDDDLVAGDLYEVPVSVLDRRLRVPIAGGFYARVLPVRFLEFGVRRLNERGVPATLYFHPWEFNPEVVRSDVPLGRRFVSFYGVERLRSKLASLLSSFEFGTISDLLDSELRSRGVVSGRSVR